MEKELSLTDTSETKRTGAWWLYVVETRLGHWYTGITTDVSRRFSQHESGKGAKNLRGKGPLQLVLAVPAGSRAEAGRLEYRIKQLSKAEKRRWVEAQRDISRV